MSAFLQHPMADRGDGVSAGKDLNGDLKKLAKKHGQNYLMMEINFPRDYPTRPFALRVVSPRCMCALCALVRFSLIYVPCTSLSEATLTAAQVVATWRTWRNSQILNIPGWKHPHVMQHAGCTRVM